MRKPKITSVIVVYNKSLQEPSVCIKIKEFSDVFVVDNSTIENSNQYFCERHGLHYISMGGNKGLSKAYNIAIDHIKETDAIVILDDDTDVPDEYFVRLRQALIDLPDVDIFTPIVHGQDGVIYSPNNYNFFKNELVKNPKNEVIQDRFNAISSCMAIRKRVFDDYRYNEQLFVDEIDHCFCREQREKGRVFHVLDIEILQNFHQRNISITPEAGWERLRIRICDIIRHARLMGGGKYVFFAFVKCCGLGVQIGKKCKSIGVMMKSWALSCRLVFNDNEHQEAILK